MSTIELREYIYEEYLTNPLCEIREDAHSFDLASPLESLVQYSTSYVTDDNASFSLESSEPSFECSWRFSLKEQLFGDNRREVAHLAEQLVDLLDNHGFLPYTIDELVEFTRSTRESVCAARDMLMHIVPQGIGCKNTSEFLAFQLKQMNMPITDVIWRLITDYLPKIKNMRYSEIAKRLNTTSKNIQQLHFMIMSLSPFPINEEEDHNNYIVPDIVVETINRELIVRIPEYASCHPILSAQYHEYMRSVSTGADREYIIEQANRVRWIASAVIQRRKTLQRISEEVVRRQAAFFWGEPMISLSQNDVAKALSVNKSTICRAVAGKYLLCKRGLFPLSTFFPTGINAKKASPMFGEKDAGANRENVKMLICKVISSEPCTKPFSDQLIAEKLLEEGVSVSRRTVAKYRSECGIRSATERRKDTV